MNNKGYTLVEIIVTLGLFSIIGVAIGISLNNLTKQESYAINELDVAQVKSAANYYATTNNNAINHLSVSKSFSLTVKDLVDSGALDKSIYIDSSVKEEDVIKITMDEDGLLIINYPN